MTNETDRNILASERETIPDITSIIRRDTLQEFSDTAEALIDFLGTTLESLSLKHIISSRGKDLDQTRSKIKTEFEAFRSVCKKELENGDGYAEKVKALADDEALSVSGAKRGQLNTVAVLAERFQRNLTDFVSDSIDGVISGKYNNRSEVERILEKLIALKRSSFGLSLWIRETSTNVVYIASWASENLIPAEGAERTVPLRCCVGVYTNVDRAIKALLASVEYYQADFDPYLNLQKIEELLNKPNMAGRIVEVKTKDKMYWFEVVTMEFDEENAADTLPLYHRVCLYDMWDDGKLVRMEDKKFDPSSSAGRKYKTW